MTKAVNLAMLFGGLWMGKRDFGCRVMLVEKIYEPSLDLLNSV
jgi:hypothetical protein